MITLIILIVKTVYMYVSSLTGSFSGCGSQSDSYDRQVPPPPPLHPPYYWTVQVYDRLKIANFQ